MSELSLVGFYFWPRPFRSFNRSVRVKPGPFRSQYERSLTGHERSMNGLGTVYERSWNGLWTVFERSRTVYVDRSSTVPDRSRPFERSWNGQERYERSGTVYKRSGTVYKRSGTVYERSGTVLERWTVANIFQDRSVHRSVPFRSVPFQDRYRKNRPSLVWAMYLKVEARLKITCS